MGETYAIVSGKGGTGKTSVCAGIASALAEQNRKVLCIDCDVGLRNLDISLGLSDVPALSFLDVSEGSYTLEDAARADEIFTILMGEQVEPRKEWIERNAKYAVNIDI